MVGKQLASFISSLLLNLPLATIGLVCHELGTILLTSRQGHQLHDPAR